MKKEIRIIGIDDAPFDKFSEKEVLVVGTIYRGGNYMDGLVSTVCTIDGNDSTAKIAAMINKCKFKPQLQAIMLDGIAVGGFNVIDIQVLNKRTKLPVVVVIRNHPDFYKIFRALTKLRMQAKIKTIGKAGSVHKIGQIHVQFCGTTIGKVKEILEITCTHSLLPEPIRVAHIIASGIKKGESSGGA